MPTKKTWRSNLKTKLQKLGPISLGIVGLVILVALINPFLNNTQNPLSKLVNSTSSPQYSRGESMDSYYAIEEEAMMDMASDGDDSIMPPEPPAPGSPIGDQAEEFEVKEYNVQFKSSNLNQTCQSIEDLKPKDYIIFENSYTADTYCNYTFKVKNDNLEEVLTLLQNLNPDEFSENKYTIQRILENYTSELDVLQQKAEVIDQTLQEAITSYDEITALASSTRDAEALSNIIESKLTIIERLSNEKINTASRIERILKNQSQQLDKLEYTYFYVYVQEQKIINAENLKDSWTQSLKEFVNNLNQAVQALTVNLLLLVVLIFQYGIYLLLVTIAAKYFWKLAKHIWKK
jgi:hypothetical protein